jgi:ABC transporter substrate binding protein (PQQ-dependent alcohol dehydrogenase system)
MQVRCMFLLFCALSLLPFGVSAQEEVEIKIAFVTQKVAMPLALSNLLQDAEDLGVQGARLGLNDNNTTGRFTKQKFILEEKLAPEGSDVVAAVQDMVRTGQKLFVLDLDGPALKAVLSGVVEQNVLFFNARAQDNDLRQKSCDFRLLHTIASRAMLTDALAQFMITKRWSKWFLIQGQRPEDQLYALSLKRSAKKFGAKFVEEKTWDGARDARRTAQSEVPLLTQGADYDVMMVADEIGDFGEYLMYRTFDPRPVAGTQGLFATSWFWTVEQWGALQFQNRFIKQAKRGMTDRDYAAWAAVRSIGEAATRTKSSDFKLLNSYIRSDEFQLGAYKGRKLSYRNWNGQLRQPVILTAARSLVAQAPLEGFLHQHTELDTLGFDRPESQCKEFVK